MVSRSLRRAGTDHAVLTKFDDQARAEALAAGRLLHYVRRKLTEKHECLSFCPWETSAQAHAALRLPNHQAAVEAAASLYDAFSLERYTATKTEGLSVIALRRLASRERM